MFSRGDSPCTVEKTPNKKQADPQTCGLSALRFNTFTLTLFMLHNVFCSSAQTLNLCSLHWNYDISHGIDAENRGGKHAEQKWDFGIRLWRCVIFFQPWKLIWVCPVRAKIWRLKTLEMHPSVHPCIFLRAYLSWGQWVGLSCHRWLPAQLISHHSANPEPSSCECQSLPQESSTYFHTITLQRKKCMTWRWGVMLNLNKNYDPWV